MDRLVLPSRVYLDVTSACPLRCRHCCTGSGAPLGDELRRAELLDVIRQVRRLGVSRLVFSGGEPLLRPELDELLAAARGLDLQVTVLTSGLLIDEVWARRFREFSVGVKVSLDGVVAETHDFLRGPGTFDRTIDVLRRLVAAGVDPAVHYTVHRRNFRELGELPALLARLGVRNLVLGTIKPAGRATAHADLLIPPRMVCYVQARVEAVRRRAGLRILSFADRGWGEFGCPATCNKLGLTADGRLTTCAFFGRELLGDSIRRYPLAELWRRHLERRDLFVPGERCRRCPALARCAGGCRARALYYHGDLGAPDPYACALRGKQEYLDANRDRFRRARERFVEAFA